jgi:hypothetical protein
VIGQAAPITRTLARPVVDTQMSGSRTPRTESETLVLVTLNVVSVLLVAVTMGLALAHALELPGKLRLDESTYRTVQTIYYPGFTIGGISEPLAIVSTLILLFATPRDHPRFWLIVVGFIALVATQIVFWFVTQPTNRIWLRNEKVSAAGAKFFAVEKAQQGDDGKDWISLRNRWEYSHVVRAVFSGIGLIALVIAAAI